MRMIVAVDRDNAIGWSNGRLPWRSARDLKRFKELTSAGSDPTVIMGRRTFESIGKLLPGRRNIILTRNSFSLRCPKEAHCHTSLDSVLAYKHAWLIGGAQLYHEALDRGLVDELYVTLVHQNSGADVKLEHDLYSWKFFAVRELKRGRSWMLDELIAPNTNKTEPELTFIKLVKLS